MSLILERKSKQKFRRDLNTIMHPEYLGCMHQTRISFSRALIRKMIKENWEIKNQFFELDKDGFGYATYQVFALDKIYTLIVISQYLPPEDRLDRVIAEKWDLTCSLYDGVISKSDIPDLEENITKQEAGRFSSKVLTLSRANKSVRMFQYVIDCLSNGTQPEVKDIKQVGYLIRTTAVYGNGKFGISDYPNLSETPLSNCFSAQMLTVYLLRNFCIDWVEHIAKHKNSDKFVSLSDEIKRYFGVGNSTGLGMAPFLVKHPFLIHQWIQVKEELTNKILSENFISEKRYESFLDLLKLSNKYFEQLEVYDEEQTKKNSQICIYLTKLLQEVEKNSYHWLDIEDYIQKEIKNLEILEIFYSILLELYPEFTDDDSVQEQLSTNQDFNLIPYQTITEFWDILKQNYDWALECDFSKNDESHYFWYRSEEKEEPRLGLRYLEEGHQKEIKIDIARQVWHLNQALESFSTEDLQRSISFFLLKNPKYRSIVCRVQSLVDFPYGEIRGNIIGKEFIPISILRCKLAFFGATKFDPKSDRWLRITLFQGSPLIVDGRVDKNDAWFMYSL